MLPCGSYRQYTHGRQPDGWNPSEGARGLAGSHGLLGTSRRYQAHPVLPSLFHIQVSALRVQSAAFWRPSRILRAFSRFRFAPSDSLPCYFPSKRGHYVRNEPV